MPPNRKPPLMSASAMTAAPDSGADWRRVVLPIGLGLLVLGGVFNAEVSAAIRTWIESTAYNHCFLVIPIAAYLLWDRRFDLSGIAARPWKPAFLLGVPVALVWLLAERLGIMEGRQLAAMTFVELLLLAVLGRRLWWAMAGPLLYLYFLVPFGEFLTPQLQDITTWFIRHGLETLGVPAFIDGYVIEIPQGSFFVAEACAGLRFLIASIAFGCLYALMMYRSPARRTMFIIVSIVVPVIANGFRGIGIVYLGYLLNSAQAAAADHIIYGWVFFSFVILLLILLGLPFRQDHMTTRSASDEPATPLPGWRSAAVAAAAVVAVACISPSLAGSLALASAGPGIAPEAIDVGPECTVAILPADLPHERSQRVTCGRTVMVMRWQALSPRSTAAAVMAARRQMCQSVESEGLSEAWLETADGSASAWRIMQSSEPAAMLGVSVWVDGKPERPGIRMRVRMALDSLLGSPHAPVVMTVTPVVDWGRLGVTQRRLVEAGLGEFLAAHPGLDRVAGSD